MAAPLESEQTPEDVLDEFDEELILSSARTFPFPSFLGSGSGSTDRYDDDSKISRSGSSNSSVDGGGKAKKKKEKMKQTVVALPKFVRNDVRRYYIQMLVNVYNSRDPELFQSFFLTYAGPHFTAKVPYLETPLHGEDPSPMNPLPGLEFLLYHMSVHFAMHPDLCCTVRNGEIIANKDGSGVIIKSEVFCDLTRLYNIHAVTFMREVVRNAQRSLYSTNKQKSLENGLQSANASSTGVVSKAENNKKHMSIFTHRKPGKFGEDLVYPILDPFAHYSSTHNGESIPLLAKPVRVRVKFNSTFYVNERRQITGFEADMHQLVLGSAWNGLELGATILYNAAMSAISPALSFFRSPKSPPNSSRESPV